MLLPVISTVSAGLLAKLVDSYIDWQRKRREFFWQCVKKEPPSVCYIQVNQKYPMPNKKIVIGVITALSFASFLWIGAEIVNETEKNKGGKK